MSTHLERFDVPADFTPDGVPCAALWPDGDSATLPLCLFLHGGGVDREMLAGLAPVFERWWSEGVIPPMAMVTPSAGAFSFYLGGDDGTGWDAFLADALPQAVVERRAIHGKPLLAGISMGGFGALKAAFARPERFAAVAALQPMLEPGLCLDDVPPRHRAILRGRGPESLLGAAPDPAVFDAHNPANRARRHAEAIRAQRLPVYLEAGDRDVLRAHEGTEFLHRVLWDLDLPHEYRLIYGADHVGPSLPGRLRSAFEWLAHRIPEPTSAQAGDVEQAWSTWLDEGGDGPPPSPPPPSESEVMRRLLRYELAGSLAEAEAVDREMRRTLGRLPAR